MEQTKIREGRRGKRGKETWDKKHKKRWKEELNTKSRGGGGKRGINEKKGSKRQ